MKRIGDIFDRIADIGTLSEASKRACSSRKDKGEVASFQSDKERKLQSLLESLRDGTYHTSEYRMFEIHENGKIRFVADLPLYPDRILHWAIALACEDRLNAKLIGQTYASVPGRGYHQAVHQLWRYMKSDPKIRYAAILDISKFFPSIPKEGVKARLRKTFKDDRFLELMDRLIDEYPYPGIPIGNRYSPMLANLYLSDLDHMLKETYHVHYYVRFMDDICILGYSKEWLGRIIGIANGHLQNIGLSLKRSSRIVPIDTGIPFLGHIIFPTHIRLSRRTKTKMKRAVKEIKEHESVDEHDRSVIASYHGVLKWCNGRHLEETTIGTIEMENNPFDKG